MDRNEAIEVIRKNYTHVGGSGTQFETALRTLIPELKESEDEMIRKTLINIVKGACNKYGIKYQGKEISEEKLLAWLEKQGSQNLANSAKTCKVEQKSGLKKANDLRTWLYIVDKVLTEFRGIGQYLDNPICKEIANMLREEYCFDDTSSDWDRVYRKGLDAGEIYGYNKAKKEQNPAWSEEDEVKRNALICLIEEIKNQPLKRLEDWDGYISWLKSLKERVQPQNK